MLDASTISFGEALRELRDTVAQYDLGPLPLALCETARVLFGEHPLSLECMIQGTQQAIRSHEAGLGLILASGLFNALGYAKAENDLARRDVLLDELRALARSVPDAAVHDALAHGLLNTRNDAKTENDLARRDALLDELRTLAHTFPDDAGVRAPLAGGLLNTRNDAKAENDLARRAALLDELRALARSFPDAVHELLLAPQNS